MTQTVRNKPNPISAIRPRRQKFTSKSPMPKPRPKKPGVSAKDILNADYQNVVKKAMNEGRPLTPNERALVESRQDGQTSFPAFVTKKVDLANHLDISRQLLNKWTKNSDFPKRNSSSLWDVVACRKWVKTHGHPKPSTEEGDDSNGIIERVERARIARIRADRLQLGLDKERGLLAYVSDVARIQSIAVTEHKRRIFALPAKLSPRMAIMTSIIEIQELLTSELVDAFETLVKSKFTGFKCPHCDKGISHDA